MARWWVWVAWRRYARIMVVAEFIGEQARCPACDHYGFRCAPGSAAAATRAPELAARCPKCSHCWRIAQDPEQAS